MSGNICTRDDNKVFGKSSIPRFFDLYSMTFCLEVLALILRSPPTFYRYGQRLSHCFFAKPPKFCLLAGINAVPSNETPQFVERPPLSTGFYSHVTVHFPFSLQDYS